MLLPVAGRPVLDWILDRIREIPELAGVHVVTNHRFSAQFEEWAPPDVEVHDDGTTSDDDKLGAIGDLSFAVERANLGGDDLLVVAGDNLFDFSLRDYVGWWGEKHQASAVALHDVGDFELAKKYGIVELDDDDRVVGFVEKPEEPPSTLAATATYVFHRNQIALLPRYVAEGNSRDQPGNFIAWLHTRAPVYGYRFSGDWLDIGDRAQLLEADNRWRARAGLPERQEYALS